MEIAGVIERVERIGVVRSNPAADTDLIKTGLVAVREARAWLDAQHAGLVTQLRAVDSFPEQAVAEAAKASLGQAAKSTERSTTLNATPKLGDALADGAITAEHVDAVTRASKQLDGAKRNELIKRADALAAVAAAGTVDQFARRLDLERKRLEEDDGRDRLARQRRNARARSWVDVEGMWNLSVKLDPLTGVSVAARIDAMVQALFANVVPDECPSDPIEKQQCLNARAVTQLLLDEALGNNSGPRPTRQRPGELNLGRTTRLANRAQRHRQLAARVQRPSHQDSQRRLDHRTRTQSPTHPPTPRRDHPHHRPTQPATTRRLTESGWAPPSSESSRTRQQSSPTIARRCSLHDLMTGFAFHVHRTPSCGV